MEQRNGRGERQGNWAAKNHLGNSIDCFYYATERTLDASMYNTVSLKSRFIAQIKTTSNTAIRTVKDIEEDVDMGGMAAELSGDPIFKERATLQKKIGDLERSNRAFLQNRYNLEDRLKREHTLLNHYEKRIATLEKTIPLLDLIPKDPNGDNVLKGMVGKTAYSKLGEFGRAILEEATYAKKYMAAGRPFELGSMWGFKVFGEITGFGDKEISRYVVTPSGEKIGSEKPLPEGEMAVALQVRDIVLSMPSELKHVKQAMANSKDNILEYGKQLGAENPHGKNLENSRLRMDEVNKTIKERSKVENGSKEENGVKRKAA